MSGNLEQLLLTYYLGKLRAEKEVAIYQMRNKILFKELQVGIS